MALFNGNLKYIQAQNDGVYNVQPEGCLVQVGNGIELEAVGLQFEPYLWRPCGVPVTWDSSRTVVVTKLRRTCALHAACALAGSVSSSDLLRSGFTAQNEGA